MALKPPFDVTVRGGIVTSPIASPPRLTIRSVRAPHKFALFWFVGGWALRDAGGRNRPARVGLVCGLLGLVGVLAFWVSVPIILGGLAIMLSLQGRRLGMTDGRRGEAVAAFVTGACAVAVGAIMWSFIT